MVVVGFPATPLLLSRARVCISASHTREELEAALRVLDDVVDLVGIRYSGKKRPASKLHANGHSDALTNGHAR
jgi:serine palmitoyltransferase